jgi:hypothetical protein
MSDDLLRYLSGPNPYSPWWMALAAVMLLAVIGWYAGVVIWTLPTRQLRSIPGIRAVHARVIRHQFTASIRAASTRHRTGELSTAAAAAAISRTLRSFLALRSGSRVQYLHIRAVTGELATAAPVLAALNDARFGTASEIDLAAAAHAAEEVIRSWT